MGQYSYDLLSCAFVPAACEAVRAEGIVKFRVGARCWTSYVLYPFVNYQQAGLHC